MTIPELSLRKDDTRVANQNLVLCPYFRRCPSFIEPSRSLVSSLILTVAYLSEEDEGVK